MPKSKVRKKPAGSSAGSVAARSGSTSSAAAQTSRVKVAGPSSPLYIGVMLGLMILGLLWIVIYYLWGQDIPVMNTLQGWNFLVGFGLMVIGLLMTMRWR
ncbi:cell division protein CrgA [Nakamurella aerolata]|uniref:cell division protein CrgA n=1 Tax=Nakamurella aerolata TaxID=1656892 RepID=UPI0031B5BC79